MCVSMSVGTSVYNIYICTQCMYVFTEFDIHIMSRDMYTMYIQCMYSQYILQYTYRITGNIGSHFILAFWRFDRLPLT